jgi:hypothetical protein
MQERKKRHVREHATHPLWERFTANLRSRGK